MSEIFSRQKQNLGLAMSHFVGKCTTELNFSIENLQLFVTTLQVFAPPLLTRHDASQVRVYKTVYSINTL